MRSIDIIKEDIKTVTRKLANCDIRLRNTLKPKTEEKIKKEIEELKLLKQQLENEPSLEEMEQRILACLKQDILRKFPNGEAIDNYNKHQGYYHPDIDRIVKLSNISINEFKSWLYEGGTSK